MADTKITALAALTGTNVATGDQFPMVDISDTTMAASGTDKNITAAELAIAMALLGLGDQFGCPNDGTNTYHSLPNTTLTGAPANDALLAGTVYYEPFVLRRRITVTELAGQVTTAATTGSKCRLGIYKASTNYQPAARLLDAGEITVDTTGVKSITGLTTVLDPGLYVKALHVQAATSFKGVYATPWVGSNSLSAFGSGFDQMRKTLAYAALADPGVAWDTTNGVNTNALFAHHLLMKWT